MDLHTLTMLLSFNEADLLKDMVHGVLSNPEVIGFIKRRPKYEKEVQTQLEQWSRGLGSQIQHAPVPPELESEFLLYQECQQLPAEQFRQHETRLLCQLAKNSPFHDQAISLIENLRESNPHNRKQLFLQKWRESLLQRIMSVEMELAETERERMLKELESRIEIAGEVEEVLNPQTPGKLWDLSRARLLQGDLRRLRHFATFLARNPELQQIAAELGRSAREESEKKDELSQYETQRMQYEKERCRP